MNKETTIQMINPTGRVVTVSSRLRDELIKQGFRVIVNAKEQYYNQYDQANSGYWKDQNVVENIQVDNFLEVDRI